MKSPRLSHFALMFRNATPDVFEEFVNEFEKLALNYATAVVTAPADEVFVAQGRAQFASSFLRLLKECHLEPAAKPSPDSRERSGVRTWLSP